MNTMSKIAALLVTMSAFSAGASADSLTGRLLSCSFQSSLEGGLITTNYRFIEDENGKPAVAILDRDSILPYTLSGTQLTVEDPNDSTLVYDLSKNPILRTFQSCVFPGEGGGGSHQVCESVTEICHLN
jgi:hypothetical protein